MVFSRRLFHPSLLLIPTILALLAVACMPDKFEPTPTPATKPAPRPTTPTPTPTPTPAAPATPPAPAPVTSTKQYSAPPAITIDPSKKYTAIITTNMGVMKLELFVNETPSTVNNFVFLANEHFYDGVKFHRVIKNFMIQGGDPRGTGSGGPGYTFRDEPVKRQYVRGTLAMANAGANTNGSQFFIVHQNYSLQPSYTIFGILTEGFDTLDKIATTQTNSADAPVNTVIIQSITIAES